MRSKVKGQRIRGVLRIRGDRYCNHDQTWRLRIPIPRVHNLVVNGNTGFLHPPGIWHLEDRLVPATVPLLPSLELAHLT